MYREWVMSEEKVIWAMTRRESTIKPARLNRNRVEVFLRMRHELYDSESRIEEH